MVSRCINPACGKDCRLLNAGELYALERRCADTEFFWLCPACAAGVAPYLDAQGCVAVGPRTRSGLSGPPQPDTRLRLAYPLGNARFRSPADSRSRVRANERIPPRSARGIAAARAGGADKALHKPLEGALVAV